MDDATAAKLQSQRPWWSKQHGACPACVQQALLTILLERGASVLGRVVQDAWPLDAESAFGALPTPLRMRADPRFTGTGVTIAVIDAAFYPHDDLVRPVNRIRAWVDASDDTLPARHFTDTVIPCWPGSAARTPAQWHGLMTSATLAGNGWRSHGLYRGLAPDASLILVQVQGADGRIGSTRLLRALEWILSHREALDIGVVNVSLGVGLDVPEHGVRIDAVIAELVAADVSVVVASGNDGERSLAAPATAPSAITVGGLDDGNAIDAASRELWHSNYGDASDGRAKPELVAPSIWIVAPIIPGSALADEAWALFERRGAGDASVERRIAEMRLVTPHYQHVEGTSFASPIVSGVVACMREAHPALTAERVCPLLEGACDHVSGATRERQGAGAIDAGRAVASALALAGGFTTVPSSTREADSASPDSASTDARATDFRLHDARARSVHLVGSWDGWRTPGVMASMERPGVWRVSVGALMTGVHHYKFLLDESRWLADPCNHERASDGHGGWNSVLHVSH